MSILVFFTSFWAFRMIQSNKILMHSCRALRYSVYLCHIIKTDPQRFSEIWVLTAHGARRMMHKSIGPSAQRTKHFWLVVQDAVHRLCGWWLGQGSPIEVVLLVVQSEMHPPHCVADSRMRCWLRWLCNVTAINISQKLSLVFSPVPGDQPLQ